MTINVILTLKGEALSFEIVIDLWLNSMIPSCCFFCISRNCEDTIVVIDQTTTYLSEFQNCLQYN